MSRVVQVTTFSPHPLEPRADRVAIEAPLEVRLYGEPFAVIMRTPGDDEALTLGFLLSESIIDGYEDVAETVSWPDDPALGNRINVVLTPRAAEALSAAGRRRVAMSSACGLCGRVTIESLRHDGVCLPIQWSVPTTVVGSLPSTLRATQRGFDETGGVHAAGLFDRDGALITSAEDVGRHNAVDKVVGRMLRERRLPLEDTLLAVSERVSFEIVQKALIAGIPLVAAMSAPSKPGDRMRAGWWIDARCLRPRRAVQRLYALGSHRIGLLLAGSGLNGSGHSVRRVGGVFRRAA